MTSQAFGIGDKLNEFIKIYLENQLQIDYPQSKTEHENMSDNEYARFEISDYDLEHEFNPNRPGRRQTKQQQIYGIWADDSDNDSDLEQSGRRRGKRGRSGKSGEEPKDYTAPVSFVVGGIQQASKKPDKNDDQITDEEDERPSLSSSKARGLKLEDSSATSDLSADEKTDAEKPSTSFGFGMQTKTYAGEQNVGSWQQHTRGIGAKLLLQMGYKPGMGLGKDLQGISQPVEAHVRKGRGAIGAYGPEVVVSVGRKSNKHFKNEDAREEKEFKEKINKWKKGDGRQDKTKRYYYCSVEEIIEKGKKSNYLISDKISKKLGNVPVIDMTGPEKRVLSGYHALGQAKIIVDEDLYDVEMTKKNMNFDHPEMMHNLNLIVEMCEQEIISLDKAEREASERQETLAREHKNLKEIVKLEQDHIQTLEKALNLFDELTNAGTELTLQRAEKIFITLKKDYASEYKEFGFGDLVAGIVAPLVKNILDTWKPLEEPTNFINIIKKWNSILNDQNDADSGNVFSPYSSLIWAGVVPCFRACASEWNPKVHQKMAALLNCWAPLFPTWILDNVLEQLILPRLVLAVNEWDPLTDTIPIHIWILPWTTILGHKMEEIIFPAIREKLGNALQAWMPQDRSARAMLTPWNNIFNSNEMEIFLIRHILPKLQISLNELVINPLQQDLEFWNQVWEWNELLPAPLMAQLLDKFFFPKWMQMLVLWLNQSPDFVQISRWYTGWKSMFTDEMIQQPRIKEHLRRALEMMHRATETPQPVSQSTVQQKQQQQPKLSQSLSGGVFGKASSTGIIAPPALMDLQIVPPPQLEFKEVVLQKCSERGIIFAPMPGRREFGKQVYRVGKLFCYIDRNVVMLSDGSFKNWTPTSVALLLERAISGTI